MVSDAVNFSIGTAAWLSAIRILGREPGVLLGNVGWFGLASLFFGFLNHKSVFWTIPKSQRTNKLLVTSLRSSMGFLGGMNAAMVLLSALFLAARRRGKELFKKAEERRVLFTGFALGHFSQVWFQRYNPPGILWYIYWMDLAQCLANAYCARAAVDDDLQNDEKTSEVGSLVAKPQ